MWMKGKERESERDKERERETMKILCACLGEWGRWKKGRKRDQSARDIQAH